MKNTLKVVALGLSIMALSTNIQAQNHKKSDHKKGEHHHSKMKHSPKMMLEKLDAKLDLNKTQEKRVFTLLEQNFEKRNALREERKRFRKNEKQEMKSQLANVLNKDQMAKLEKMHQERKAEHKRKKGDRSVKGEMSKRHHREGKELGNFRKHVEKMKLELDLSKEQESKVSKIMEAKYEMVKERKSEMRAHKENMKTKFGKGGCPLNSVC